MRIDEIKAAVGTEVPEIERHIEGFHAAAGPEADPDQFLAYLRSQGVISDSRFRELHTRGTLVLKDLPALTTQVLDGSDGEERILPSTDTPYTFLGQIGAGAMGEVQIARDHVLQRKVALKRMHADLPKPRRMAARFLTEAQITAQLDHPNIVPVYALEVDAGGSLSYTMKLIRGRTLEEIVSEVRADVDAGREPSTSLDERLEHFLKVCDAIAYAHSRGVVHRDLKPENIMVGPFNEVYVMDWGICRVMDAEDDGVVEVVDVAGTDGRRTRAGTVIGTPAYMSPEQAEGMNDALDGRSDQFSLGLILYELVGLQRAVEGESAVEMMSKIQVRKLPPLRSYGRSGHTPPELVAIVDKATALEPKDRYADVAALARDIRRYRKGEAVLARPDTLRQRINRWVTRHRELLMLSVVGLMVVLFVVVLGFTWNNLAIRDAAARREEHLSTLIAAVGRQGHEIDGHMQQYESALDSLAISVADALQGPAPDLRPHMAMAEEFGPPDLQPSPRYDREVSLGHPVFSLAGAELPQVLPDMRRLYGEQPAFQRALLRSDSDEAPGLPAPRAQQLIGETGVPLAWANVALENGLSATYPGHRGFAPGYDARKAPWYRVDTELHGPQWGTPYIDVTGLGLVLPCSQAMHGQEGELLGVASVILTFEYLIDNLLVPEGLPPSAEGYLVDAEGRIVIESGEERDFGERRFTRALRLKRFPVPALVDAIDRRDSGYLERKGELVLYYQMSSLGWFYVLKGPAEELLH